MTPVQRLLLALAACCLVVGMLTGCASALPDYATAAFVHQSQPFVGHGPAPIGDHEATEETNLDGIEGGLRWERGRFFTEADVTYMLRKSNVLGNEFMFTFRTGMKFRVRR